MQESDYNRFIRNVTGTIIVIGLLGAVGIGAAHGIRIGLSFLIGATVSYISFTGWQRLVAALAPNAKRRSPWFVIRIFFLIGLAWVIIKFLGLNVAAAAGGLLVSAAAVILELIFELIYART